MKAYNRFDSDNDQVMQAPQGNAFDGPFDPIESFIKFEGVDSWNRPVFKDEQSNCRYGCLDKLFNEEATAQQVQEIVTVWDLVYFGNTFDCEPMGDPISSNFTIV